MILAHHCIFSMYGFWLPNDPRGSGSDYIAAWDLFRRGAATKVTTRHSVAHVQHDWRERLAAKAILRYPPVVISGQQALAVASGFQLACMDAGYHFHACAILPEHVHVVIGTHARNVRAIIGHLKSRATRELKAANLWPESQRPIWGAHGWNVRLESLADVQRAIRYVERNPEKEGKRQQVWNFVTAFDLDMARQMAMRPELPRRNIGGAALQSQLDKASRAARLTAKNRSR